MTWPRLPGRDGREQRPQGTRGATLAERERNPAASMALLEEVLDPPLGPGYRSAADRRVAAGLPASSGTRTWLMLLVSILIGLVATVAATALRTPDQAAAETRFQLAERVEAAQVAGDQQRAQVELLRAEIAELEQAALGTGSADPAARTEQEPTAQGEQIAAAGVEAGATALHGPGVVIVLADAPPRERAPGETPEPERVTSRDIQLIVNGLWSAGAEGISVNEHRLTSTSAIRFAGKAIIVDFRGLTPPYEIRAVGDPVRLGQETTDGLVGAYLSELRSQVGLRADVQQDDDITIGAAERLSTRLSELAPEQPHVDPTAGDPTPAPDPEKEDR